MKRMILFVVILMLLISLPVYALESRAVSINPTLSFTGTTATCKVQIFGNTSTDDISATIKLWQGNSCIETWTEASTGYLIFNDTATVTKGKTYKLTVDAVIDGREMSTAYVEKKCP